MITQKVSLLIKVFVFASLMLFTSNSFAEYYLVYGAQPPIGCLTCKKKVKKAKCLKWSHKKVKKHYVKRCVPRDHFSVSVHYFIPATPVCSCPRFVRSSCGPCGTEAVVAETAPRVYHDVVYTHDSYNRYYFQSNEYIVDLATADDNASIYPDMNVDNY